MKKYELMLLLEPNLGEEKVASLVAKIEEKIKSLNGEVSQTDKWGIRRLAHVMQSPKRLQQAYYVVIYFQGPTSLPGELQAYLKVTEDVVRHGISLAVPKPVKRAKAEAAATSGVVEAVNVGEIKTVGEGK